MATITLAWGLLGIAVILVHRDRLKPETIWSMVLVGVFCLPLLPLATGLTGRLPPFLVPIPYLFGPLLLAYSGVLLGRREGVRWSDLIHAGPFLLWSMAIITLPEVRDHLGPMRLAAERLAGDPPPAPPLLQWVFGLLNALSILGYGITAARRLTKAGTAIRDHHSQLTPFTTLSWLRLLVIVYISAFSLAIAALTIAPHLGRFDPTTKELIQHAPLALFIFVFVIYASAQKRVLVPDDEPALASTVQPAPGRLDQPKPTPTAPLAAPDAESRKYDRSGLDESQIAAILGQLRDFMQQQKPYLQSDLTLESLSRQMNLTRHYISQAINATTGANFYRLVNEYRVAEFGRRVAAGEASRFSLAAIAMDCGFGSVTAFYTAMKQITGQRPGEFARSVSQA